MQFGHWTHSETLPTIKVSDSSIDALTPAIKRHVAVLESELDANAAPRSYRALAENRPREFPHMIQRVAEGSRLNEDSRIKPLGKDRPCVRSARSVTIPPLASLTIPVHAPFGRDAVGVIESFEDAAQEYEDFCRGR